MRDTFLEWLNLEIDKQSESYCWAAGLKKRHINARLLALKECRNRYIRSKEATA